MEFRVHDEDVDTAADAMKDWLLSLGIGGTGLVVVRCFTPFLPWFFGGLGLTSAIGIFYSDAVLLPTLAFFLLLTGYAIWRRRQIK